MRSEDNPNLVVDWDTFEGIDRSAAQKKSVEDMKDIIPVGFCRTFSHFFLCVVLVFSLSLSYIKIKCSVENSRYLASFKRTVLIKLALCMLSGDSASLKVGEGRSWNLTWKNIFS